MSTANLSDKIAQIAEAINVEDYTQASVLCNELQTIAPGHPQLFYFQGAIAAGLGELAPAAEYMQQALSIGPSDWPEVHHHLGLIYQNLRLQPLALSHLRQAQGFDELARLTALIECSLDVGAMREALTYMQEALTIDPQNALIQNYMLFALPAVPGLTDQQRKQLYVNWAQTYYDHYSMGKSYKNSKNTERKLKIGYVSSDFRQHAAANDLFPLYKYKNKDEFEIYSYSSHPKGDALTDWFRAHSDSWCDVYDLSGVELTEQIQQDGIDILVDCSGHTAGNRLRALSLKPAPIQVSAFGFVFTTGMKAFDYQFSDEIATPPHRVNNFTEKLIHLTSQIHWAPLTAEIRNLPQAEPPCMSQPYITFGSGNGSYKHNDYVLKIWAAILRQVPHSRIHFKHNRFGDEGVQQYFIHALSQEGIDAERILFSGTTPALEHLLFYNTIDIALDPFPYTGGMTTCETLFMGTPIIALDGDGIRTSQSLLTLVGAPELIAKSPEEYVFKAIALARNPQKIQEYKQNLRKQMERSAIMHGRNFTGEVERAYREIWKLHCSSPN